MLDLLLARELGKYKENVRKAREKENLKRIGKKVQKRLANRN